jgi:hypothetical protein
MVQKTLSEDKKLSRQDVMSFLPVNAEIAAVISLEVYRMF